MRYVRVRTVQYEYRTRTRTYRYMAINRSTEYTVLAINLIQSSLSLHTFCTQRSAVRGTVYTSTVRSDLYIRHHTACINMAAFSTWRDHEAASVLRPTPSENSGESTTSAEKTTVTSPSAPVTLEAVSNAFAAQNQLKDGSDDALFKELHSRLFTLALTDQERQTLATLSGMGLTNTSFQQEMIARTLEDANESTLQEVEKVIGATPARVEISTQQLSVALQLRDLFMLVFPPSARTERFSETTAWLERVYASAPFVSVAGTTRMHAAERIGKQIDRRPQPIEAATGSDGAVEKNMAYKAGKKKEMSQRQKEKAAKKAKQKAEAEAEESSSKGEDLAYSLSGKVSRDADPEDRIAHLTADFDKLGLTCETVRHVVTPTVDEMMAAIGHLKGGHCKNLFLKGKKPSKTIENDSKLWLVVALHDRDINLKEISKTLGYKVALRFGRDDVLNDKLGVRMGEVSPFALLNNVDRDVQVLLDKNMMNEEVLWFHPLSNAASTSISPADLRKWISASGRTFHEF